MAGFNFAERRDIERVLKMVHAPVPRQLLPDQTTFPQQYETTSFLLKTPAHGIPAGGNSECTPYYLNVSGVVTEHTDNDDASQTYTVHNPSPAPIYGDIYITANRVYGTLIAEQSYGSYILLTPASGIPAMSGGTAGSAACTPYYMNTSAGAVTEWVDSSSASQSFTVYNISASAVLGSKYIQAKVVGSALVVDMEDCG